MFRAKDRCPEMGEQSTVFKRLSSLIYQQDASSFNVRVTGVKLATFLLAFTVVLCSMTNVTLEGLALKCEGMQFSLTLTKQALHKRLIAGKKELKILLSETTKLALSCSKKKPKTAEALDQFGAVKITDATTISLPDKLSNVHNGLGGSNSDAALKIQATYDVISNNLSKIDIRESARENDASYMDEVVKDLKKGELSITDLGYFGVGHFRDIANKEAFFMSKIKNNTVLYTLDDKRIDAVELLKNRLSIDIPIIIKGDGGKTALEVRLCGVRLPEDIYNERIRKARKSRGKGNPLTKDETERLKWMLIITNVPAKMLEFYQVCEIYRIRWQVELVFKSWKSYFAIDVMNNVGKDYLDCLIYGKLIVITMLTALYSQLNSIVYENHEKRMSFLRFMSHIRNSLNIVLDYLMRRISDAGISHALERIICACLIEKRKRKTTEQIVSDFNVPEILDELEIESTCTRPHAHTG